MSTFRYSAVYYAGLNRCCPYRSISASLTVSKGSWPSTAALFIKTSTFCGMFWVKTRLVSSQLETSSWMGCTPGHSATNLSKSACDRVTAYTCAPKPCRVVTRARPTPGNTSSICINFHKFHVRMESMRAYPFRLQLQRLSWL